MDKEGICAYVFSYPSTLDAVTPLGGAFHIPEKANTLYLHDLAVSKRSAGLGVGLELVGLVLLMARTMGLDYSSLVSVQNSFGFWSRLGYKVLEELDANQAKNLNTYHGSSSYMLKSLTDFKKS